MMLSISRRIHDPCYSPSYQYALGDRVGRTIQIQKTQKVESPILCFPRKGSQFASLGATGFHRRQEALFVFEQHTLIRSRLKVLER